MLKEQPRNILLRAPNWIGDAVMCEPALRGLRSLFPEADITMLAKSTVAELFRAAPELNRVLVYEDRGAHAGLSGKWALAGLLRRHGFDLAVLFQNAFEAAFIAWLAGIPQRYGYATDGRVFFLTTPVAVPERSQSVHQVEYYWNLLKPLGLPGSAPFPTLSVTSEESQAMDTRLTALGSGSSDIVIGINPGSTYGSAKRWLPERFAEVARRLAEQVERDEGKAVVVAILGAKGEESLGEDIASRINGPSVVLSGATTIRELMAAVKRCRILVTNDTGPMHVAAACGVPVVAVFGPTDSRTTAPYGQEQSVVREVIDCAPCLLRECPIDHRCMTRISTDRVYEVAVQQLNGWSRPSGLFRLSGPNRIDQTDRIDRTDQSGRGDQPNILSGYTIFLDRDGTLNPDPGYIKSPDQFELFPGVAEALARLKLAGARLILITNQSGIARGLLSRHNLEAIHKKLRYLLGQAGATLDGIYFCPHHPDDGCGCRKPNRGMIDQAIQELGVDPERSYVIGDHLRDIELAKRVGARSVLVTTGVTRWQELEGLTDTHLIPDRVEASLTGAVDWLLSDVNRGALSRHE